MHTVIFQQPRPGPSLPKGEHYLTVGWKQIWVALTQFKKLPYTFVYLLAFFLLADVRLSSYGFPNCSYVYLKSGFEHNWNACINLSEREVSLLVPAEHVPRIVSGYHVHRKHFGLLVYPTSLEDQHQEDGSLSIRDSSTALR